MYQLSLYIRSPHFDELVTLYGALYQAGVGFTSQDRQLFVKLARQKLEAKKTHKAQFPPEVWEGLRQELACIDQAPDERLAHSAPSALSTAAPPRIMETRHLVGRVEWSADLCETLKRRPPVKMLVLQGPAGSGKTSELHRIANHFLQSIPRYFVALCELPDSEKEPMSPELALEMLLNEILLAIEPSEVMMPMKNLEMHIKSALNCLAKATRPVLLILDNAEHLFNEAGTLTPCWDRSPPAGIAS